jgi:ABC-type transport system involved in Fe-S cluster assembly fused permease/ATPase subunit
LLLILWLKISTWIFYRLSEYSIVKLELGIMKKIYMQCFDYLHGHSYSFFTNNFGWSLIKKVNKLVRSYEWTVDMVVSNILPTIVWVVFIMTVIFIQSYLIWFIFLAWLFVYIFILYFLYKKKLPYDIEANLQDSHLIWQLADTIINHFNILTFASKRRERERVIFLVGQLMVG